MIKAAVLGSPISHSLSPLLHKVAYDALGLESDYSRIEIKSGELAAFLTGCDESWRGFSLTMPLKEEVLELADEISELALTIRSANTLVADNGKWSATTTDVSGFTHALDSHGRDASGDVLIIGAGATARAAAAACDGVSHRITVMARSLSRVDSISEAVKLSDVEFIPWGQTDIFESADLIISTTPNGASDSLTQFFPLNPTSLFFDVLYHPWPTLALETWSGNGGQIIDGLDLLIYQAIVQVGIFSGISFDRASMAALMRSNGESALKTST